EVLLKRRKKSSPRCRKTGLTKSIVDTEARDVSAELTEDIAAARMATIRNPRNQCGTSVSMKTGKMKSFAWIPGRDCGNAICSECSWKKTKSNTPTNKKIKNSGKIKTALNTSAFRPSATVLHARTR